MDIYNKFQCTSTSCTVSSWLTSSCRDAFSTYESTIVEGDCNTLVYTYNNNCKFAYSNATGNYNENIDTVTDTGLSIYIWVAISLSTCVIVFCVMFLAIFAVMGRRKRYGDPELYSTSSTIVGTGNAYRSNYSSVQPVSQYQETPRTYEQTTPQPPKDVYIGNNETNNNNNYSPYKQEAPYYISLNKD